MIVTSVFTVVDYKTKEESRWEVDGCGQKAINHLRKDFPRFSKFVLDGWNIDENFVPLKINSRI